MTGNNHSGAAGAVGDESLSNQGSARGLPPLRPAHQVVPATLAAVLVLTPLLVLVGFATTFLRGERLLGFAAIGLPLVALSVVVSRWLGAGVLLVVVTGFVAVMTSSMAVPATEHYVLSERGEKVDAVVAERSGSGPISKYYECTLARPDGTPIRPGLSGSYCMELSVGETVPVIYDPEGRMVPILEGRDHRGKSSYVLAGIAAGVHALLFPVAAVRARFRRRKPGPPPRPAYLVAPPVPGVADGSPPSFRSRRPALLAAGVGTGVAMLMAAVATAGRPDSLSVVLFLVAYGSFLILLSLGMRGVGVTLTPLGLDVHRFGGRTRHIPWQEVAAIEKFTDNNWERVRVRLVDWTVIHLWRPHTAPIWSRDRDFDRKVRHMQQLHASYSRTYLARDSLTGIAT